MLQLYFLIPPKPDPKEEEKKNSPSKKAALPPKQEEKKESPSKQAALPPTNPKAKPLVINLKENMVNLPKEVVEKYNFFLQLFAAVRKSETKVMSNDPALVRQIYLGQKSQFAIDERQAQQMIVDFFSPAEFLKRLDLHREYICKSKTKKQQKTELYYVEIPGRERQINLVDYVPIDKVNGLDAIGVIQKDIDDKKKLEEQKEIKRLDALEAKKTKAKLDKAKLEKLA